MRPKDLPDTIVGTESRYYRLTAQGKLAAEAESLINDSRYLHDVLLMCRSGIWFQELRQFVPPRSLVRSLQSLQAMGLIEGVAPEQMAHRSPPTPTLAWEATDFNQLRSA